MPPTSPVSIQVVVDCTAPRPLADWWAETLGWEVEPQDEAFIRSMIDKGFATEAETITHAGSLVWKTATAVRPASPTGSGQPRLLFQQVPEAKAGKNRLHLDLRLRDDGIDLAAFRESLLERGATEVGGGHRVRTNGSLWPTPRATNSASTFSVTDQSRRWCSVGRIPRSRWNASLSANGLP